jgi:hypothetical protein
MIWQGDPFLLLNTVGLRCLATLTLPLEVPATKKEDKYEDAAP